MVGPGEDEAPPGSAGQGGTTTASGHRVLDTPRPWVRRAATAAIVLAIGIVAGRYAVRAFDLSFRDYGEAPILAMVERMSREPVARHWLTRPPYTLSCYGPGYYIAVSTLSPLTPWRGTLIPGRLVALLGALATTLIIAGIVTRETRRGRFGLFAGLLFFGSSVVAAWVPYHRVDTLAIPFAVAAYGSAAADKRRGLVAAAVLIAAGSLVKQTVALAALPILIHLAITRRFRPAAAFAVGVALLGGGLWLAVDRLSGGYFLTVAIHGNVNRLAVIEGLRLAVGFLQSPTVLVGLLAAAWLLYHEAPMAVGSLYWVALVVSTLLAVPAAMKEGAAINYFLEPAALAAIVIGVHGLPRLAAVYPTRITAALGLLALLVAIPGVGSFPLKWEPRPAPPELPPAICERLRSGSHGQPPLVLADSCCVDAVLAAGAEPVVNDPLLFRFMVDNGTVEAQPLLAALNAGRVRWLWLHRPVDLHRAAVGLSVQRWPATVIEAMERRYAVVTRKPGLAVYQFQAKTAGAQE